MMTHEEKDAKKRSDRTQAADACFELHREINRLIGRAAEDIMRRGHIKATVGVMAGEVIRATQALAERIANGQDAGPQG